MWKDVICFWWVGLETGYVVSSAFHLMPFSFFPAVCLSMNVVSCCFPSRVVDGSPACPYRIVSASRLPWDAFLMRISPINWMYIYYLFLLSDMYPTVFVTEMEEIHALDMSANDDHV